MSQKLLNGIIRLLEQRHFERYPGYSYERRKKRKAPEEEFIHVNTDGFHKVTKKKKKVQTLQTKVDSKSNLVNEKGTPASTSLAQEEWFYNSLAIPTTDISWDIQESYQSHNVESYNTCPQEGSRYNYVDENIPKVANEILSLDYTDVTLQQFQQLQLIQQQQLQQQLPEQQLSPSYLQQQLPVNIVNILWAEVHLNL